MDSFRSRFNVFLIIITIIAALVGVQIIRFQLIQHVDSKRDVPELLKAEPASRGRMIRAIFCRSLPRCGVGC